MKLGQFLMSSSAGLAGAFGTFTVLDAQGFAPLAFLKTPGDLMTYGPMALWSVF